MFNTDHISGNDDDIFDDSKSLLDDQQSSFGGSKNEKDSTSDQKDDFDVTLKSVFDVLNKILQDKESSPEEAYKILKNLRDVRGDEVDRFLAMLRIRLANTILDGSGSWVQDFESYSIPRSVAYSLDCLLENRFTLVEKFFNIELENAKRIVVCRFLKDVFLFEKNVKKSLTKIFDTGLDYRYIKMYYETLYDINMFTIVQNNGLYAALGEELNLPCNQDILDCKEVLIQSLTAKRYLENKFVSVLSPVLKDKIAQKIADSTSRYLENVDKKND
jgi:hypothetical protein